MKYNLMTEKIFFGVNVKFLSFVSFVAKILICAFIKLFLKVPANKNKPGCVICLLYEKRLVF